MNVTHAVKLFISSVTRRERRYAVSMIERLLAQQETLLAQEYSRSGREDIREMNRFLYQLRDGFEQAKPRE